MASPFAAGLPRTLSTSVSPSQWKNGCRAVTARCLSLRRVPGFGAQLRQPFGQFPRSRMVEDVLMNQPAHHLRRSEVLLGADFLEELFLLRIDQKRDPGGAVFHGVHVHVMCMT